MSHDSLIKELHDLGAIKFGTFTLKSGIISPIYLDLRLIVSSPPLLQKIADAMWEKIAELPKDLLCGVPYTALPIATAISLKHNIPMLMRRKEKKEYGTKKLIEGKFQPGNTCLIIEDLVTSGGSVFETIEPLEELGLAVKDIVVLIDREQGAHSRLKDRGYKLHAVFTMSELLHSLHTQEVISEDVVQNVQKFIQENHFTPSLS